MKIWRKGRVRCVDDSATGFGLQVGKDYNVCELLNSGFVMVQRWGMGFVEGPYHHRRFKSIVRVKAGREEVR